MFPHVQIALDILIQAKGPNDIILLIMNKKSRRPQGMAVDAFPVVIGHIFLVPFLTDLHEFQNKIRRRRSQFAAADVAIGNGDDRLIGIAQIMKDDFTILPQGSSQNPKMQS